MSEYFPKPNSLEANVNVQLDLSNYEAKADLKNETRLDIWKICWKIWFS